MGKKGKMQAHEDELISVSKKDDKEQDSEQERWWRLWDVSANCKEIGNIDCDGGFITTSRLL